MSARDTFSVFLHDLDANEVEYRVLDDGRHVLQMTEDISLYVRPDEDDLPAVVAGLRKLAATASEMADALTRGEKCSTCEEPYGVRSPGCEEHTEWLVETGVAPGPGTDGGTGAS